MKFFNFALNLSWLISLLFAEVDVYALKSSSKTGIKIWDFVEDNAHFAYSPVRLQYVISLLNKVVRFCFFYINAFIIGSFIFFELQSCEDNSEDSVCGMVYPNVNTHIKDN